MNAVNTIDPHDREKKWNEKKELYSDHFIILLQFVVRGSFIDAHDNVSWTETINEMCAMCVHIH